MILTVMFQHRECSKCFISILRKLYLYIVVLLPLPLYDSVNSEDSAVIWIWWLQFHLRDRSCLLVFNAVGKLNHNNVICHMITSEKTSACSNRLCACYDMKVLNSKKKIHMNFRIMQMCCRLIVLPAPHNDT